MKKFELEILKQGIEDLRVEKFQEDKNEIAKYLRSIIESKLSMIAAGDQVIPEKLCRLCGKRETALAGTICDVDGCVRNRRKKLTYK